MIWEFQWKDGSVWTRDPCDVTGPWFDEQGERKVIEPVGAGTDGKLKAVDDACREVGRGEVGQGQGGKDKVSMEFADGKEGSAEVSPDGQVLQWADRPAWTRVPCTVAGRWYDEQNQPRQIEAVGDKGEVTMSDDAGKPVGKGKLGAGKDGQQELGASFVDGTEGSAPVSADGQTLVWDDGSVWRRVPVQEGVLGSWYDKDGKRRTISVDPTAEDVKTNQGGLSRDFSDVKELLKDAKRQAAHPAHQLCAGGRPC